MHVASLENNMLIYHTDQPANAVRKTLALIYKNPNISKHSVREKCSVLNVKVVHIVTTGLYSVNEQKRNYIIIQVRI